MNKVLIVDDFPVNRQFLTTLLGHSGFETREAENGAKALPVLQSFRPDVAIVDIAMPVMDGFELVSRMRRDPDLAKTPVIFYTASYRIDEARTLARDCGVEYVLMKPAEPEAILRMVQRAIEEDKSQAPESARKSKFVFADAGKDEIQRLSFRLATLVEFGRDLSRQHDVATAVDLFTEAVRGIVGSDAAIVHIIEEGEEHYCRVDGVPHEQALRCYESENLLNLARRWAAAAHVVLSPKSTPLDGALTSLFPNLHAYLGVPIASESKVYGWCGLLKTVSSDTFGEDDERIASTMAAQMAIAYENVTLFELTQKRAIELRQEVTERMRVEESLRRHSARQETLAAISNLALTAGAAELQRSCVERIQETLGFDHVSINRLLAGDQGDLVSSDHPCSGECSTPEYRRRLLNEGDESLPRRCPNFIHKNKGASGASIPIARGGNIYGLLCAYNTGDRLVAPEDIDFVRNVASILSLAFERARAEEALRNRDKQLADSQMMAHLGSWERNVGSVSMWWSDELYRIHGFEVGKNVDVPTVLSSILPEDRPRMEAAMKAVMETGSADVEYRICRPDGSVRVLSSSALVVREGDGTKDKLRGTVQDITERKAAEDAIAASESAFRSLIENIPDVVWTIQVSGITTFISPGVERLTGFSAEEIRGHDTETWMRHIHPEDLPRVAAWFEDLFRGGASYDVEFRFQRKDGHWIWIHDRSYGRYERNGVLCADGIFSDVTLRKSAEQALRESEEKYREIISFAPVGIIQTTLDGRFLNANEAAWGMLGCQSLDELLQLNIERDVFVEPSERRSIIGRLLKGGVITTEVRFRRRHGPPLWVEATAHLVRDAESGADHIESFLTDITGRREAEEVRRRAERDLERAERLGSLGRVAASMAHEFNNVLMGIQPFAEIVRKRTPGDERLQNCSGQIIKSVARGRQVTQEILRMAHPGDASVRSFEIGEWLQQAAGEIRGLLGKSVQLEIEPAGPLYVRCDSAHLQQVLTNLVINARDAMPGGGRIRVKSVRDDSTIRITVADEGSGIPAEMLTKIFEPLFTTKKTGTGLGLAIAQQLLVRSGGTIDVESTVGEGTTFFIRLPAAERADIPAVKAPPARPSIRRVLLVDDEPAILDGVAALLEGEGFEVRCVDRGMAALEALKEFAAEAIVLDITLPDLNGIEVFLKIRENGTAVPVIFASGHVDDPRLHSYAAARDVAILKKPYDLDSLLAKLQEIA